MRGILMFAHNNGLFDYGKMAYASALSAAHHIDEPISLVSDDATWNSLLQQYPNAETLFDTPILIDFAERNNRHFDMADGTRTKAKYHNTTRLRAYELTPYDETLLIDTDVLVQDSVLRNVWGSPTIRMNHQISNLAKGSDHESTLKLSDRGLTAFWATICYFPKNEISAAFFKTAQYVAERYDYYAMLYDFPTGILRVDFVFTITAHLMSGCVHEARSVVEPLPNEDTVFAWNRDVMIDVTKSRATFLTELHGRTIPASTYRTVHCMNKDSMMNMANRIIDCYA